MMREIDEKQIREMFRKYTQDKDGIPRHSECSRKECDELSNMVEKAMANIAVVNDIESKAMDMAVEFEEDGFVAGFKFAIEMLKNE